jgi:hypothetical protein
LGTERSKETYKLVGGEPGLTQDRAENAALDVGASVVRDDYACGGDDRDASTRNGRRSHGGQKAGTL